MDRIHSVRRHALTLSLTLRDGREGPQGSGVESSRYRLRPATHNPTPRIHRIIRFISTGNHTHTLRYDGRTIVGTPPSFLRIDPRQPRQSEGPVAHHNMLYPGTRRIWPPMPLLTRTLADAPPSQSLS
ncbi:uncharacterized protein BO87DRAFT_364316 [Aspergillus neoniger CBS 115656]|uniref:Uncharacterized protein n=1 Tax=Aspergillus neoniger (strain CBS 115656) TaxID=1448310 RepID=A0A318YGV5_ASPNB|nr:hypothetical protein BO87DRAFT_364316 [Aspergillus neoniger CBS 115656]PYH31790.1 hypothetical protein BO87DRAFT_364316 [Aspergillus neoniger CBS 115656]